MNAQLVVFLACVAYTYACGCTSNDVVCTIENETKNECELKCDGKEWMKACDGPCPCSDWIKDPVVVYAPQPCGCDNSYSPVCATNGNTYQNECQANCNNLGVRYSGPCH